MYSLYSSSSVLLAISTLKDTFYYYLYDKLYYTPNMCVYYWQVTMKGLAFWVSVFAFGLCNLGEVEK